MSDQNIINISIAIIGTLMGWFLKVIYESLKDLRAEDSKILTKVNTIEVLIAGGYVTRQEFLQSITAIFAKLDSIEDKIDRRRSNDHAN